MLISVALSLHLVTSGESLVSSTKPHCGQAIGGCGEMTPTPTPQQKNVQQLCSYYYSLQDVIPQ